MGRNPRAAGAGRLACGRASPLREQTRLCYSALAPWGVHPYGKATMSVDAAIVRRIAHLARIALSEEEVEPLRGELNAILSFIEQLSDVNVEGVEPMTSVTAMQMRKR